MVWLKSFGLHLGHGTLDDVPVLQRQKRDEEVHQVLGNQTRMPQATYGKKLTDTSSSTKIHVFHQI